MIRKLTGLSLIEWLFVPFLILGNLPGVIKDAWKSRNNKEEEG